VSSCRAEPHRLYAGVVFPRFNRAGGAVQWNGTGWSEATDAADSLLVDETFHVMVNGSYVPGASITHAREVGLSGQCLTRHLSHFEPSSLEKNCIFGRLGCHLTLETGTFLCHASP